MNDRQIHRRELARDLFVTFFAGEDRQILQRIYGVVWIEASKRSRSGPDVAWDDLGSEQFLSAALSDSAIEVFEHSDWPEFHVSFEHDGRILSGLVALRQLSGNYALFEVHGELLASPFKAA